MLHNQLYFLLLLMYKQIQGNWESLPVFYQINPQLENSIQFFISLISTFYPYILDDATTTTTAITATATAVIATICRPLWCSVIAAHTD